VKRVVCGLLDLLFPDECRLCHQPLHEVSRIPVCASCLSEPEPLAAEFFCATCHTPFVNRAPLDEAGQCSLCRLGLNGFDQVYSFGAYEGSLRELIHLYKFGGVQPLSRPLGALLARALPRETNFDAIVPMPLHWRRRWERGFNQSDFLAQEIARRWNTPVRRLVHRKRATVPQAGLTSAQRRLNVRAAFSVKPGLKLTGQRILLIDDVLTTGATASACARALKRAGASQVTFLALARRDRRTAVTEFERAGAATAGSGA
jgi:ComF family protein